MSNVAHGRLVELVFTLCHKCYKYNCLPWKMQNHTRNSYITLRKQLSPATYGYIILSFKIVDLIDWETFDKISITRWIMKPCPYMWWNFATGDIACSKRILTAQNYARTVHLRFWLASYEHLNIWSTKYKLKYSIDLDCFETKRNEDDELN